MSTLNFISNVFFNFRENNLNLLNYLAYHAKNHEVQKLIDLGWKEEDAVFGYALAGQQKPNESHYPGSVIRGYARGGIRDYADICSMEAYLDNREYAVLGFAEAGKNKEVILLLSEDISLFEHAVIGYASCNHKDLLLQLISGTRYYPQAVYNAARSRHNLLVDFLLAQFSASDNHDSLDYLMNFAAKGYVAGCHFAEASILLDKGASVSQCVAECLPKAELCLALAAHVKDLEKRKKILERAELLSSASSEIFIIWNEIIVYMEKYNFNCLEAYKKLMDSSYNPIIGDITLESLKSSVAVF